MPDFDDDIFGDLDGDTCPHNGQDHGKPSVLPAGVSSPSSEPARSDLDEPPREAGGSEEPSQPALFDKGEWWDPYWRGMPEFVQENQMPWKSIYVHFESRKDMEDFSKLVGQRIGLQTRFIWYPEAEIEKVAHMAWVDTPIPPPGSDDGLIEIDEGEA